MELVYHDNDIVVINKPPGMWPEQGLFDEPGVLDLLQKKEGIEATGLNCLYSLEQSVSGLMLWTRNEGTQKSLEQQFNEKRLNVVFLALVRTAFPAEDGVIDRPLRKTQGGNQRLHIDEDRGTKAVTEWHLRDRYVGFALLECRPLTSIAQQVRAHLEFAEMPLAVDPLYGGAEYLKLSSFKAGYRPSRRRPERPLIQRPTLHLQSISFKHPNTGDELHFEASFPKDFRATLHQLDRFGRVPK